MVQIEFAEDTQGWRDVADQMPPEWIPQLERAEELAAAGVTPWRATSQADNAALGLLFKIKADIEAHQAGVRFAHVPVPDHVARVAPWMNIGSKVEPEWTRTLEGSKFEVNAQLGHVVIEGTQFADGSIMWGLRVVGDAEDWMEASAARRLADALRCAAEVVESL
ncbi:hypothetical protein [Mycobacteroides abscessus]|nr:hypothetical protein [Mycobacteroides abscessus]SHQ68833.1 Uncharacterised protein [Mycobacteroides abscessus subsp. abscessus]SHR28544.1 Uncharacterised protein [Mycobacteroides abscessus subsp. abscessus]SHR94826.1 Uncharacterised protein [Mycobacteroides abscessus subsp. abscessus]SHS73812.1 Uncharacterised protein [Mycobacteroides abscessus subsp. abscessus]SHT61476.1 Uncharacterised protein [Mycobacteroides abscessus subsp. abscessus]